MLIFLFKNFGQNNLTWHEFTFLTLRESFDGFYG